MDYSFERNNRFLSLGITLLFAALLLLIFFFIKFITPIPPFDPSPMGGLEVNIGYDPAGMGDNNSTQPVSDNQKKEKSATQPESNSPSDMISTEEVNNVAAPKIKKNKKKNIKVEEPLPDQNLLNALSKVNSKTGSNTGDGNTNTPGNQGDPNGTLNSNVYSKGSTGPGEHWKLKGSGRKMIGDLAIYDDSQETGIVAVEIMVDKNGKITKAEPVLIGSTTTSSILWKKAKDGLLNKVLFNQSPTGEEARGTIYINFTVR
ncbi:MAG TPA: hypothetical protein VII99_16465 [Bacteroidia bacterium]